MIEENKYGDKEFLFKAETYAIRGAIFEVYNELGSGFWKGSTRNVFAESLN